MITQFTAQYKTTPTQASKKSNEEEVFSNLKDKREVRKPKFKLGQLVRTADIKRVFSKGDSTNYSYRIYAITEIIQVIGIYYYHPNYVLKKTIKL